MVTIKIWSFSILIVFTFLFIALFVFTNTSKWKTGFSKTDFFVPPEWLIDFFINMCGYAIVIVPGALLIYTVKKYDITSQMNDNIAKFTLIKFIYGSAELLSYNDRVPKNLIFENTIVKSGMRKIMSLTLCSIGLITSYLIWGVAQERLVSHPYEINSDTFDEGEHFKDSLFLEFANRLLSLIIALVVLLLTHQPIHKAPVYEYSYNSFTCLMSSWCQYEALKFVSFPIQVLVKASKIIPVMLMGWLISKRTYTNFEYCTAILMSIGLFMFITNEQDAIKHHKNSQTSIGSNLNNSHFINFELDDTVGNKSNSIFVHPNSLIKSSVISGSVLMIGYIGFDSFTSNWQSEMYKRYSPSHVQMMFATNCFEVLLASITLIAREGFQNAYNFSVKHPIFVWHLFCLAITSTIGQFFIFYTIKRFGPVTFTIIMTVRQAMSVFISCFIYGHVIHYFGIFGVSLFFFSIALRVFI